MSSWVKYHFTHLRRWREYTEKVSRAVQDLAPDAKVYVIGGVAEGRTTIYSDIDILVVVKSTDPNTRRKLLIDILERAIDTYGLPWDAPVELHVVGEERAKEYLRHSRNVIRIL